MYPPTETSIPAIPSPDPIPPKRPWYRRWYTIAGASALILAIGGGTASALSSSHTGRPPAPKVTHSAPAVPRPSAKAPGRPARPAAPAPAPVAPAAPVAPVQPQPGSADTSCGSGVYAGPDTSCAFASNVAADYPGWSGSSATVYSPTTGQYYTVAYASHGSLVEATNATGADVLFYPGGPSSVPRYEQPGSGTDYSDPSSVVAQYYADINSGSYPAAWSIGGSNLSHGSGYNSWVAGYSDTTGVSTSAVSTNGNTAVVNITAYHSDGSVTTYQGTYTVANGEITGANITQTS